MLACGPHTPTPFNQLDCFFDKTPSTRKYTLSHTTLFRSPLSVSLRFRRRNWGASAFSACAFEEAATCCWDAHSPSAGRSEEHTSELQSHSDLVCRLLLEKKKHQ